MKIKLAAAAAARGARLVDQLEHALADVRGRGAGNQGCRFGTGTGRSRSGRKCWRNGDHRHGHGDNQRIPAEIHRAQYPSPQMNQQ